MPSLSKLTRGASLCAAIIISVRWLCHDPSPERENRSREIIRAAR